MGENRRQGMTASQAMRLSLACRDIPFVFEQPCNTMEEVAAIRHQIAHPIIIDENTECLNDVLRAIALGVCDGFGLKMTRIGGLNAMATVRYRGRGRVTFRRHGRAPPARGGVDVRQLHRGKLRSRERYQYKRWLFRSATGTGPRRQSGRNQDWRTASLFRLKSYFPATWQQNPTSLTSNIVDNIGFYFALLHFFSYIVDNFVNFSPSPQCIWLPKIPLPHPTKRFSSSGRTLSKVTSCRVRN
jgi:hypothetical protein